MPKDLLQLRFDLGHSGVNVLELVLDALQFQSSGILLKMSQRRCNAELLRIRALYLPLRPSKPTRAVSFPQLALHQPGLLV